MANMIDAIKGIVESINENPEIKEELLNLKKELANEIIAKFEEEKPDLMLTIGRDLVSDYLIDEGWSDKIHDALVEKGIESLSSQAPELKEIREKLNKAKTEEELKHLKAEIIGKIENPGQENQTPAITNTPQENSKIENEQIDTSNTYWAESIMTWETDRLNNVDIPEGQKEAVHAVLKTAESQIGKPYVWGATGEKGFDCSGLWNWTFKQQGITFKDRFTASLFSQTDVNINKNQVRSWDFMYRDQKPGSKKHNPIYHIEMVVDKPFLKNGKWYVKTIGSSTDKGVLDSNGQATKNNGVGYRLREINSYRHFGRPPYYLQLAQQKSWDTQQLIASRETNISKEDKEQILT